MVIVMIQELINNEEKYSIGIIDDRELHNVIFFYFHRKILIETEKGYLYCDSFVYNVEVKNLVGMIGDGEDEVIGEIYDIKDIISIIDLRNRIKLW